MNAIIPRREETFSLEPSNFSELMTFAEMIANSDLAPKDYRGKQGNAVIAIQMGLELGLKPMAAIQNIAVINGRPSLWGDALKAIVIASPLCEYVREEFCDHTMTATCRTKRVGQEEHVETFSREDAEKAGLWTKSGTWQTYPKRMLKMRARGFCLRDIYADLLKGLHMAEESLDMIVIDPSTNKPSDTNKSRFKELFGSKEETKAIEGETKQTEPEPEPEPKQEPDPVPTLKDHKKWLDLQEYFEINPEHLANFKKESIEDLSNVGIEHFDFIWKTLINMNNKPTK